MQHGEGLMSTKNVKIKDGNGIGKNPGLGFLKERQRTDSSKNRKLSRENTNTQGIVVHSTMCNRKLNHLTGPIQLAQQIEETLVKYK